jgi:hypothetical protein
MINDRPPCEQLFLRFSASLALTMAQLLIFKVKEVPTASCIEKIKV